MSPRPSTARAFTLIELLVVAGILSLLLAMLLPGLSRAKAAARATVCASNLRQIYIANDAYAAENNYLVPGAADFLRNRNRWHGARASTSEPFRSAEGPLAPFLGPDGAVQQCPDFPADDISTESGGFEQGCGGYGYNNQYLGAQTVALRDGSRIVKEDRAGVSPRWIARPEQTIMFSDAAFAAGTLIEYSFAEPRYHPVYPQHRTSPSMHFRHAAKASVAWSDGHVDTQPLTFTAASPFYPADPARHDIGWPGDTDDNRLFDLE